PRVPAEAARDIRRGAGQRLPAAVSPRAAAILAARRAGPPGELIVWSLDAAGVAIARGTQEAARRQAGSVRPHGGTSHGATAHRGVLRDAGRVLRNAVCRQPRRGSDAGAHPRADPRLRPRERAQHRGRIAPPGDAAEPLSDASATERLTRQCRVERTSRLRRARLPYGRPFTI